MVCWNSGRDQGIHLCEPPTPQSLNGFCPFRSLPLFLPLAGEGMCCLSECVDDQTPLKIRNVLMCQSLIRGQQEFVYMVMHVCVCKHVCVSVCAKETTLCICW